MSAYSGTPTVDRSWEVGDRFGARREVSKDLSLTLSSQGGATNTIGDTALGFSEIYSVQFLGFVDDSGSQKRALFTWTDGTNVYVGDPQDSTDNTRGEPADVSGALKIRVTGLPV